MSTRGRYRDVASKVPPPDLAASLYGGVPLPRAPDPDRRYRLIVALVIGVVVVASVVVAAALR